jgi:hypothetical protein
MCLDRSQDVTGLVERAKIRWNVVYDEEASLVIDGLPVATSQQQAETVLYEMLHLTLTNLYAMYKVADLFRG